LTPEKKIFRGNKDSVPVVLHNLCFVPLNPHLQQVFIEAGNNKETIKTPSKRG
jgi:hypothetical protein